MLGACSFIVQVGGGLWLSSDSQRHSDPEKVKTAARCPGGAPGDQPQGASPSQGTRPEPPALGFALSLPGWRSPAPALRTFPLNFAGTELKVTSRHLT